MQPWNSDIFTVDDLIHMLCRLPAFPANRWTERLKQGGPPRQLALEISGELAGEDLRLRKELRETLEHLSQASEKNETLIQILERERQSHTVQVANLENKIWDLNELLVLQQKKINPEKEHENN